MKFSRHSNFANCRRPTFRKHEIFANLEMEPLKNFGQKDVKLYLEVANKMSLGLQC